MVWRMDSFRDRLNVHRWVLSYFRNAGKRRWELKAGCGGRNGNRGQGEENITKTWRWDVYRRWGAEKCCEWKSLSRVQLFASPWTIHGILQARILEWVTFLFSRESSQPRDQTQVSRIAGGFFTIWATREAKQETWVQSLGQEDTLEEEMATHPRILAWEIPWKEEPGRLQSMGPQRVGLNTRIFAYNLCTSSCSSYIIFRLLIISTTTQMMYTWF